MTSPVPSSTPTRTCAVRFCGGCNPTYDRGKALRTLAEALPDVAFVHEHEAPAATLDYLLIICGCIRRCIVSEPAGPGVSVLYRVEDLEQVRAEIEQTLRPLK